MLCSGFGFVPAWLRGQVVLQLGSGASAHPTAETSGAGFSSARGVHGFGTRAPRDSLQKSLAFDEGLLADFTAVPAMRTRARWPGRGLGFPGRCRCAGQLPGRCWLGAGAAQVQPGVGGCSRICTDVRASHRSPPGAVEGCSPAAAFGPGCGGAHPPSGHHRGKPGCCIVGCNQLHRYAEREKYYCCYYHLLFCQARLGAEQQLYLWNNS